MEATKTLLVITAIVNKGNRTELPEYLKRVMPIFGQHGGKPAARYQTVQSLLGEDSPEMVAVIEFDNPQVIKDMVQAEPFRALAEMRARVFDKLNMIICQS